MTFLNSVLFLSTCSNCLFLGWCAWSVCFPVCFVFFFVCLFVLTQELSSVWTIKRIDQEKKHGIVIWCLIAISKGKLMQTYISKTGNKVFCRRMKQWHVFLTSIVSIFIFLLLKFDHCFRAVRGSEKHQGLWQCTKYPRRQCS